jgi:hypothetical protein
MLNTSNSIDYPTVYLTLEVDPRSQDRAEIIQAMKDICKRIGWKGYELDDSRAWSRIVLERSLQSFLAEEDRVVNIQKFFLEALNELSEIKTQYPQLPWVEINSGRVVTTNPFSSTSIDEEILAISNN